jgi:AcrR family transcriptional regulator
MTTSVPTRTQTERADQTRARILDAAIHEFSENGLAGARTEQIAEEAGVNKALLYYYFKGKEELYVAALERWSRRSGPTASPCWRPMPRRASGSCVSR